jgi:thiamine biosynthesis lipoprotein
MGTTLDLVLEAPRRAAALAASELAVAAVEAVEERLSTWRAGSELSRLNRSGLGEPRELSRELGGELARAFAWREVTGGAFDPALGPLLTAWDLHGKGRRPSAGELADALSNSGPDAFRGELPWRLVRLRPGAGLDAGGFGKGAALDAALAELRRVGVLRARLDFGGQLAVLGASPAHISAIAAPDERARGVLEIELAEGSLATSGNSERALVIDGERVGHLLDPRSGEPAEDFGSVTVWCPSAFDADCLSTGLFVLGPEGALDFAARRPGVEVVVLTRAGDRLRARASSGLRGRLHSLDPSLSIEWIPTSPTLADEGGPQR